MTYNYNDLYSDDSISGGVAKFTFDITQGNWDGVNDGKTYFDNPTKASLISSQQTLFKQAIQAWENVANVHLTEGNRTSSSDSEIVISMADEHHISG